MRLNKLLLLLLALPLAFASCDKNVETKKDPGCVKPDRKIFEHLCAACGIAAEETAFVDDNEKNIRGANDFGITGILFDGDVNALRHTLDKILG